MDAEKEQTHYWMTEASPAKAVVHMAVPMILGMVAMSVYNFTDTFFVSMAGDAATIAAITLSMPVMSLLIGVSMFFEVGAGTAIARAVGSGDYDASRQLSAFAVTGTLAAGIGLTVILEVFLHPLLGMLGAEGETLGTTGTYLSAYCLGAPFVLLSMVGAQLLRAIARSKEAAVGMAASAMLNIVLDPIAIFGLNLGLQGAALATVASNAASAAYFVVVIARSTELSASPVRASITKEQLADVTKIGFSAMLMAMLMGLSSLVFNNAAMKFGAEVVAAFGIAQCVVQLLEVVTMGLYEGVTPLIGAAWGARNPGRLKAVVVATLGCLGAFCAVACATVLACSEQVLGLFTNDSAVLEPGSMILAAQVLAIPFAAASGLAMSVAQGCGKGVCANVLSTAKGCVFMGCIIGCTHLFGLAGIAWSLLASEGIFLAVAVLALCATFGAQAKRKPTCVQIG